MEGTIDTAIGEFSGQVSNGLNNNWTIIYARNQVEPEIKNLSDDKLINFYKTGVSVKPTPELLIMGRVPKAYAFALASLKILEERNGQDFALDLAGCRRPESLKEKIYHFFNPNYYPNK